MVAAPTDSSSGQSGQSCAEVSAGDTMPQHTSGSSNVMSLSSGSNTASTVPGVGQGPSCTADLTGQPPQPAPPPWPPTLPAPSLPPLPQAPLPRPPATIAPQAPSVPLAPPTQLAAQLSLTSQPALSAPAEPRTPTASPTPTTECAPSPLPRLPPQPPPPPTQPTLASMVKVPPVPTFTFPKPPLPPRSVQPAAASITASLPEQLLADNSGTSDPTRRIDAGAGGTPAVPKIPDSSYDNPEKGGALTDAKRKAQRRGKRGRQKRPRVDTDPKRDTSQVGDGHGEPVDDEHTRMRESKSPKPVRSGRGRPEGVRGGRGRGRGRAHLRYDGLVAGPILRHNKSMFAYGNYDPHFRERHERYASMDPRIEVLLRVRGVSFFWSKATLDIGCGAGFVAFLVANLGAARVDGVDIDTQLVSRALKQLRKLKREGHDKMPTVSIGPEEGPFPISLVHSRGIIPYSMKPLRLPESTPSCGDAAPGAFESFMQPAKPLPEVPDIACPAGSCGADASNAKLAEEKSKKLEEKSFTSLFPHNLEFRTANMLISELEEHRQKPFDVVLCMKLTKWVHLNWGDDGLKVLFHKCFRLLRPGGTLVLEAQEWSSYRDVKHLTPHMRENKNQITLRPSEFVAYLVGVVGFQKPETLADPSRLKRPLLLFLRPEQPPRISRGSVAAAPSVGDGGGPPTTGPAAATTLGQTSAAQMVAPPVLTGRCVSDPRVGGHMGSAAAATLVAGSAPAGVAPADGTQAESGAAT